VDKTVYYDKNTVLLSKISWRSVIPMLHFRSQTARKQRAREFQQKGPWLGLRQNRGCPGWL